MGATIIGQRCRRADEVEVVGSTGNLYRVTFGLPGVTGAVCECKGFTYHGRCYHLEIAEKGRCTWRSGDGERQTVDSVCPRCSGPTVPVQHRPTPPLFVTTVPANVRVTVTVTAAMPVASSGVEQRPIGYSLIGKCEGTDGVVCLRCAPSRLRDAVRVGILYPVDISTVDSTASRCGVCDEQLPTSGELAAAQAFSSTV